MFKIFHTEKPVIGMIHLLPLPGSPQFTDTDLDKDSNADITAIQQVFARAQEDYNALREGGVDGILVENFWDLPYFKDTVPPQTVSWMTRIILSLSIDVPFGVNVLRNDAQSALAVAHATGGQFIRCNILTGVMATDQGLIEGKAAQVLRYRKMLDSDIQIFADVLVKYAHSLGNQSIERAAKDTAYRGLADALIVTGSETGEQPVTKDLETAKKVVPDTFLFAGSGVTPENVQSILVHADGCIVGKAFKKDGKMENAVDKKRVEALMTKIWELR